MADTLARMIAKERGLYRATEDAIRKEQEHLAARKAKAAPWIAEAERIMAMPDGPARSLAISKHCAAFTDDVLTWTYAEKLAHEYHFSSTAWALQAHQGAIWFDDVMKDYLGIARGESWAIKEAE